MLKVLCKMRPIFDIDKEERKKKVRIRRKTNNQAYGKRLTGFILVDRNIESFSQLMMNLVLGHFKIVSDTCI